MIERLLYDGIYTGALRDEIDALKKSRAGRKALSARIREILKRDKRWPRDEFTRALLAHWLIGNGEVLDHVRLRHPYERKESKRDAADEAVRQRRSA